MDDGAALLRAICEQPEEDTPRLMFADWLEEHGGEPERAEFIRVQVELAKLPPKPRELFVTDGAGKRLEGLGVALVPRGAGHYSASGAASGLSIENFAPDERVDVYAHLARTDRIGWLRGLKFVRRVEGRNELVFRKDAESGPWKGKLLAAREQELLRDLGPKLFERTVAPLFVPTGCASWSVEGPQPAGQMVLHGMSAVQHEPFRRGFVERWTLQTPQFLDRAAAVFANHPVTRLVLSDKRPGHHPGGRGDRAGFWWEPGIRYDGPHQIPFELGEAGVKTGIWRAGFHGGLMVYVPCDSKPRDRGWDHEGKAIAALSDVALAYGRSLAGLPPLLSSPLAAEQPVQ